MTPAVTPRPRKPVRSFSTLGCAELSLDAVLALAGRHDIPTVEVRALWNSTDLPAVLTEHYGSPEKLSGRLNSASARVVAIGTSLRLIGNKPEDRDSFLQVIPWAEAMGVRSLRLFDGGRNGDAAEIEEALRTLDWWGNLRAREGWLVDINVETHDALADVGALERFLAAAPHCPILWDSHHTWRKGGADPVETWRLLQPHVSHIHVKDSISEPGERLPYTYVLPGRGEFPMAALMAALGASNYAGLLSLEWERLWHKDLPELEVALRSAREHRWW